MTVLLFIIVLAVLIFVHELGHFLAARACGIRVDEFSIGFGPKLFSWRFPSKHVLKTGETVYSIRAIPFGGFVKIFGENPDYDSTHGPDSSRSFVNKPRWQQSIVLASGVAFNFIFAWILMIVAFSTGVMTVHDNYQDYSRYESNPRIIVTQVASGSPAKVAGLKIGDVLRADSISQIQSITQESAGKPFEIKYKRGVEELAVTIAATTTIVDGKYAIGIGMAEVVDLNLPLGAALIEGTKYSGVMIKETVLGLFGFIGQIFRGDADFSNVAGPVGIAGVVGDAARQGFISLLLITAFISINLGVINLMPFPALDGGRILFVAIEGMIRRRISPRFSNAVNAVGFALLMALMVLVTYKDIAKLIG